MTPPSKTCLYCQRSDQEIPLIPLHYQGQDFWICSQHLPMLIHQPHRLQDKLPDATSIPPAERHN